MGSTKLTYRCSVLADAAAAAGLASAVVILRTSLASETMADKATTDAIQKDWKEREMIEIVHLNILKITKFLNEFEVSVRYKLSTLAERVGSLERHLEYCETAVNSKGRPERLDSSSNSPADGQ